MPKQQRAYLELRRNRWYVVLDIPRPLRALAGKSRLVRSTTTGDLAVANSRKHTILAEFQREIAMLRRRSAGQPAHFDNPFFERARMLRSYAIEHPRDENTEESASGQTLIGNLEAAEMLADEAPENIRADVYRVSRGEMPLTEAIELYFAKRKKLSPKTVLDYRRTIETFVAFTGAKFPKDITSADARQFVRSLETRYSKYHTISREMSALSSLWKFLKKEGQVSENPWPGLRPERDDDDEEARVPFTNDELKRLLEAMPEGTPLGDLVRIAALSGMRRGEITSLCRITEVEDVTCFTIPKGVGKTPNAARSVPVHSALTSIIARRSHLKDGLFSDEPADNPGGALGKKFMYRLRKHLGIIDPGKVFHSLRKWHMTEMERAGVNPWTAEQIQGRARQTLGLRVYSGGLTITQLRDLIELVRLP